MSTVLADWSGIAGQVAVFLNAFRPWIAFCAGFALMGMVGFFVSLFRGGAAGGEGEVAMGAASVGTIRATSSRRVSRGASPGRRKAVRGKSIPPGGPGRTRKAYGGDDGGSLYSSDAYVTLMLTKGLGKAYNPGGYTPAWESGRDDMTGKDGIDDRGGSSKRPQNN